MRIQLIISLPFDDAVLAKRHAQVPTDVLDAETAVSTVRVRNGGASATAAYDMLLYEMYIVDVGMTAETEGYDAVVIDSFSDNGLPALRSRLTIPVIGSGLITYATAITLGKKFSVLSLAKEWRHFYEKSLATYGLTSHCASIRPINLAQSYSEALFATPEEESTVVDRLIAEGRRAIDQDGADVIILGSTTLHDASAKVEEALDVPVINPGPLALKMAETTVRLGLSHSKVGYSSPPVVQDEKFASLVGTSELVHPPG